MCVDRATDFLLGVVVWQDDRKMTRVTGENGYGCADLRDVRQSDVNDVGPFFRSQCRAAMKRERDSGGIMDDG